MRYELADYWVAIKPMLPDKPRGVPRVNDRRVLNGIFWVLRSGAPWRDLPEMFGPYTTCYNRFVRWRRAGVWSRIIEALAAVHDPAVQMIDTSIVRVHQHGACITRHRRQSMGRSRGGLTSKIHAVVDSTGLPTRLALSPGEAHDVRLAGKLLSRLKPGSMLLADRGYDADWIRELAMKKGACANIPRKAIAAIRSASARTFALATRSNGSSTGSNNVVVWRRAIFNWLCHGHDAKRRERRYGHRNGFSTASGTRPQPNGRGYATVLNLLTSESARPTSIWGKPNESANPGIANAVVLTGEAVVSDTYVKRMEQDYAAKVLNNARHEDINGWVKRMTAGRIASILDRP